MNYLRLFIIVLTIVLSVSCSMISEEIGEHGKIEGIITEIDSNVYGIDGTAYPIGELFYSKTNVKYKLAEESAVSLKNDYSIGDKVVFLFTYIEVKEGDWNTVIEISSM